MKKNTQNHKIKVRIFLNTFYKITPEKKANYPIHSYLFLDAEQDKQLLTKIYNHCKKNKNLFLVKNLIEIEEKNKVIACPEIYFKSVTSLKKSFETLLSKYELTNLIENKEESTNLEGLVTKANSIMNIIKGTENIPL